MYGLKAKQIGMYGMRCRMLRNKESGIREAMIVMSGEWLFFIFVFASVNGFKRLWSFIRKLRWSQPIPIPTSLPNHDFHDQDIHALVQLDLQDIDNEQKKVTDLIHFGHTGYPIIADNLIKVYRGKHAVKGLSLSVARGECFGLLGPHGAGKTCFLNMMTGLEKPSSGKAFIRNRDLQKQMRRGYKSMGEGKMEAVCDYWSEVTE